VAQTQNLILRIVAQRGEISSGELLEVVQKFELSPDAIRAAANRMARSGLLIKMGQGRGNLRYKVGPQGQILVDQFLAKFLRYHLALSGQLAWDGDWLVVTFGIPEWRRGKRDTLRKRLEKMGFGLLSSSVWISPLDQEAEVMTLIEELELAGQVTLLRCQYVRVPGLESVGELVYRVWRLKTLETHYRDFNRRVESLLASLERLDQGEEIDTEELLFKAMDLQGELMEIILDDDPCLPSELLPSDWPSQRTHELTHIVSNAVARLEIADDDRYHYLFHMLQGMEALEAFRSEGNDGFHWPESGAEQ